MTRLELIKENKARYAELQKRIPSMTGLEKAVAEHITLKWVKGSNWMGGLSDSVANKAYEKLEAMGYEFDEIDAEFERQMWKF